MRYTLHCRRSRFRDGPAAAAYLPKAGAPVSQTADAGTAPRTSAKGLETNVDREALGLRWRHQVATALVRAGCSVVPYPDVIDGPSVATLAMYCERHVPRAALPSLADQIGHALNLAADVRLERRGRWLVVEVPFPDRHMIPLAKMRASGLRLELGITPTGDRVTVDLDDDSQSHVIIAGKTGSGKSQLLRSIAALLARANAPDALTLVLIDGRAHGHPEGAFTPLDRLAHLPFAVATTRDAVASALEWVVRERIDNAGPPCVVLVDEPRWLRRDKRTVQLLTKIAEEGRKHRVHLVLAAQRVTTDSVARDIAVEFGVCVAGRVRDWRESYAVVDTRDAAGLLGAGDMLIVQAGRDARRFQAALTAPEDVAGLAMGEPVAVEVETEEAPDVVPWWQEQREMTPDERAWIVRNTWRDDKGRLRLPSRDDVIRQFNCGARVASRWRAAVAADLDDRADSGDRPHVDSRGQIGVLGPFVAVSARSG